MTNAVLNLIVLAALAVVTTGRLRRLRPGPLLWTALVMVALTVVFDTVMIGVGLVEYDPAKMLGVKLWRAPIEDFAYALAAVALMPALWTTFGPRTSPGDQPPRKTTEAAREAGA